MKVWYVLIFMLGLGALIFTEFTAKHVDPWPVWTVGFALGSLLIGSVRR